MGQSETPWLTICLDKEYRVAGHIVFSRQHKADISFSPYKDLPDSRPFIPGVGFIFIRNKQALRRASSVSPLFMSFWKNTSEYPEDKYWIAFADPPNEKWLSNVAVNDDEIYLSNQS